MKKLGLFMAICLVSTTSSFAESLLCMPPNESAVVTQQTYGAINPSTYQRLQAAIDTHDQSLIKTLLQQGLIKNIESGSIVCIDQRAVSNYRVKVRVASTPLPVWVDDRLVSVAE